MELAVLGFLSGTPITASAAAAGITTAALTDAIQDYQAAGRAALKTRTTNGRWCQVNITFPEWAPAEETVATVLWPHLQRAEANRLVSSWWYIRKYPAWRLRLHPTADTTLAQTRHFIGDVLDRLVKRKLITAWTPGRYEPETLAFGGATHIAHSLFHADSANFLRYLHRGRQLAPDDVPVGRRELSLLLCSVLMRAAGQEWHEQGDVWHRVAQMRPLPPQTPPTRVQTLARSTRQLLVLDTVTTACRPADPFPVTRPWITAMNTAGVALAATASSLERGLRDVLAHHVIFHWNRLGLPGATQATLAHSARAAVMADQLRL